MTPLEQARRNLHNTEILIRDMLIRVASDNLISDLEDRLHAIHSGVLNARHNTGRITQTGQAR